MTRYVGVEPRYKVVYGERPYFNAEDDEWFDAMPMYAVDSNLYAVTQGALYEYTNGVDRTLRYCFTWPPPASVIDTMTPIIAIDAIWASVDATMPDLSHLEGWYASRDQQAHVGVEFD